jgi:hypothetical protein
VPPVVTDEGIVWADGVRPLSRDYTPLYDEARHELALDFYIHDGGVASMGDECPRGRQADNRRAARFFGGARGLCVSGLCVR